MCMSEKKEGLTEEQALQKLQEVEQQNMLSCSKELSALLSKYGYNLEIQQSIVLKKSNK